MSYLSEKELKFLVLTCSEIIIKEVKKGIMAISYPREYQLIYTNYFKRLSKNCGVGNNYD